MADATKYSGRETTQFQTQFLPFAFLITEDWQHSNAKLLQPSMQIWLMLWKIKGGEERRVLLKAFWYLKYDIDCHQKTSSCFAILKTYFGDLRKAIHIHVNHNQLQNWVTAIWKFYQFCLAGPAKFLWLFFFNSTLPRNTCCEGREEVRDIFVST